LSSTSITVSARTFSTASSLGKSCRTGDATSVGKMVISSILQCVGKFSILFINIS